MTPTRRRKLAVITEGDAEFTTLAKLYPQIQADSDSQLLKPLKVNVAPDAVPRLIARSCRPLLLIAKNRSADAALLVLDRETSHIRASKRAAEIAEAIAELDIIETVVVLKDRMFENWLIADTEGLAQLKGRFNVSAALINKVAPDKADQCDALALLKAAAIDRPYQKVSDAKRITDVMSVQRAGQNSRSFRKFLRACSYRAYAFQSKRAHIIVKRSR